MVVLGPIVSVDEMHTEPVHMYITVRSSVEIVEDSFPETGMRTAPGVRRDAVYRSTTLRYTCLREMNAAATPVHHICGTRHR